MYYLVRTEIVVQGPSGPVTNKTVHNGPVLLDCLERAATRIAINVEANLVAPTDPHFSPARACIWIAAWTSFAAYKSAGEPLFTSSQETNLPAPDAPGCGSCLPSLTSATATNGTPPRSK